MLADPNPTMNTMRKTTLSDPKPRRIRSPALSRVRLRRNACGGKRSEGPTTPQLVWKVEDAGKSVGSGPESDREGGNGRSGGGVVSVRKLGAGIWHVNGGLGFESIDFDLHISTRNANTKNHHQSTCLMNYPKNGMLHKLGASTSMPNPLLEKATKWDPEFYSHLKLLNDQQGPTTADNSSLQSELEQAQRRIAELETERQMSKKKLDSFLRKLAEEKEAWRRREHEKIRAIIDSMKEDLHREMKKKQRLEIVNSKLVNELKEAKLSAKRHLQNYEKERKTRELMEEVCDELAKEIGEDKAEVEALKDESRRVQADVEEERNMLQMAEVWREERVQMKLVDAKVTLEEKYSQLSKLQSEIEAFLRGQSNSSEEEKKEAKLLRKAADLVNVQEIKELFSYQPPLASEEDHIFSIFEEPKEREIEACYRHSNGDVNGCRLDKPIKRIANGIIERNEYADDASGWETVSNIEEQLSSNSIEGSDPSVNNGLCKESNASVSGTEWDENQDNHKSDSEISEVCSVATKQSRKKGSSIARLWRSSYSTNTDTGQKYSFEVTNRRISNGRMSNATLSNGSMSNATLSSDGKSEDMGLSSSSMGQWSSPDSVNTFITRGIKSCIELPRGMQKQSLKAKLMEARMDGQKIQLRQALKQKI